MTALGNEILDQLDAAERGFVLGALLLHPSAGTDPSAGLEPPSDARCGEALARIAALPRGDRVKLTRQLAREVVAPLPAGLETVEEAVLSDLLRDEPPDILRLVGQTVLPVRRAIAARLAVESPSPPTLSRAHAADPPSLQGPADRAIAPAGSPASPVAVDATRPVAPVPRREGDGLSDVPGSNAAELVIELQRALFSRVVPVHPAARTAAPGAGTARGLLLLDPAQLTAELSGRGAKVLGHSLRGARRDVILRAAALAGPPWAEQILAAAGHPGPAGEDAHLEIDRAAALELVAATAPAAVSHETVTRLGARAAGARMTREGERGLGGADQARAVAQRLGPEIGGELLSGAGLGAERV